MTRILVGEISSYKAIVIANFLKKHYDNIEIFSFDHKKYSKRIKTKYANKCFILPSPKVDPEEHINTLSRIIKDYAINLFIPVNSSTYGFYILNRKLLNNTFEYAPNPETYETLNNKQMLSKLASSLQIKIPIHYDNIAEAVCPFVVKPVISSSSKGVKYINNEEEKNSFSNQNKNQLIIQEYIKGNGCGYSIYSENGKVFKEAGHLRIAEYPIKGGSSVYRQTYQSEDMREIVYKIVKHTNYSGFAMFEFKVRENNELILIEVNPRIWGSINQGLQNGVNYFEPLVGLPNISLNNHGRMTYLSPLIYISLLKYLLKGNYKPIHIFLQKLSFNSVDISLINDPKGFLSILLRKLL